VQVGTLDELRHLTRYTMQVTTETAVEGFDGFDGVYDVNKTAHGLTFQVDTASMSAVITHLNRFGIKKLESTPPTLEELFMQHYKKEHAEGVG